MSPDQPLIEQVFDRLAADGVPDETADLVLAALCGADDLRAVLAGGASRLELQRSASTGPRPRIYLSSVTVAGFRGVGPERTLSIPPGPGLTLVVGRNGSGKSSFAEAVELALTGGSKRCAEKNSVWRGGWRNLHSPDPCTISVELRIDGEATPTVIHRSWPARGKLNDAAVTVTTARGRATDLATLELDRPLALYRPFLTATEMTQLVSGSPSALFDAIHAILGLEPLTKADSELLAVARELRGEIAGVRERRAPLVEELSQLDDHRAQRAAKLLAADDPQLDELDAILAEPLDAQPDAAVARCRQIAALPVSTPDEVASLSADLRDAAQQAQRHEGQRSRASLRGAELLRLALEEHDDTGDGPCPVCRAGRLDGDWRARASATLEELRRRTVDAQRARARLSELTRRARSLVTGVAVPAGEAPGVALDPLRAAVAALHDAPGAPEELAAHLAARYPAYARAAEAARAAAATWLRERDGGWQRVAAELRAWVDAARALPARESRLATVEAARTWLATTGERLRNERLAPFAAHSQRIWEELRAESNVRLGAMTLAGRNNRRRVEFPVSVDGADNGTALGVMSQGELHALGLAAFLPRSCAEESPFRFVVIDDPVQSMDPSKVDGLARILAGLATERQVVVFTHDSRLPDALRYLGLDAEVLEVVRAERSVVTLRPALDAAGRYLEDAGAVACSTEVPEDVRAPVVAELCRSALEAACQRVVWRTRLARGDRHADIEAALERAGRRLTLSFALALFDDIERGGDVLARLNRRYGTWAADTYQACRHGVHGAYVGDLRQLVTDARRLVEAMR